MAATALVLGLIAAALATALSLAFTLHLNLLLPFLVGAIFVAFCIALAVCIVLGLALSVLALVGRRGRTGIIPMAALAVNIVAFGAVIAVAIIVSTGESRPWTRPCSSSSVSPELWFSGYRPASMSGGLVLLVPPCW